MTNETFCLDLFMQDFLGGETSRLPEAKRAHQNQPIENTLSIRRVYQRSPVDENCWAYMKMLRREGGGKTVYPVDPYVEVYQFRDNLYGFLNESPDGRADSWMYLIIGPQKAMLVETGYGIGNLKGLVEQIAPGKQLIVVNSHCHADHSMGNSQFGTVYCHAFDVPMLKQQNEHMWDSLFDPETGEGIWAEFNRRDIIPFRPYEIIGCEDGHIFDLGDGYEVELIFMGGHSAGNACYLDKHNKTLFAGGSILCMSVGVYGALPGDPNGRYATLPVFQRQLEKLSGRLNEIDSVFTGHFITDIESSVIPKMAQACREVLDDPLHNYTFKIPCRWGNLYCKYINGLGKIEYTQNALQENNTI